MGKIRKEKQYEKFVSWCLDECKRLKKLLHLTSISIHIETLPVPDDRGLAFEVQQGHPYQHALLRWSETSFRDWKNNKKNQVSDYLLHELIHILLSPLIKITVERYITEAGMRSVHEEVTDKISVILNPYLALKK